MLDAHDGPDRPVVLEHPTASGARAVSSDPASRSVIAGKGGQCPCAAVRTALDGGAVVPYPLLLPHRGRMGGSSQDPSDTTGVWVTWDKKLARMIAQPAPLSLVDVTYVADRLATALPPVPHKT